ncbi:MAG: spore cortex biosynthesis protein YabQ [Candidatus Borkfalkiaceae bacterium]|nr:spore cortex biosynthesis protein YabQ [Clostridia bacterium]MDY6223175.1 spore cortex biosynthesis protein YabQ [Christensenellaceae bacterium]
MDAKAQFPAFLICVATGAVIGILYDAFFPLRRFKIAEIIADAAFCALAAALYVFVATKCAFPDFRIFTYFGLALGLLIYSKSMRRVVAFFQKMCYNGFRKVKNRIFRAFSGKKSKGKDKNKVRL